MYKTSTFPALLFFKLTSTFELRRVNISCTLGPAVPDERISFTPYGKKVAKDCN